MCTMGNMHLGEVLFRLTHLPQEANPYINCFSLYSHNWLFLENLIHSFFMISNTKTKIRVATMTNHLFNIELYATHQKVSIVSIH